MTTDTDGKPARLPLPTTEELKARGIKVLPPTGKGYILPTAQPPQPPNSAPPVKRHTVESLKALGFKMQPSTGGGFILPTDRPPTRKP